MTGEMMSSRCSPAGIKAASGKGLFQVLNWVKFTNIISWALKEEKQTKVIPLHNFWEKRPHTASITWDMYYEWKDEEWMKKRKKHNSLDAPWSVYEVHLASWHTTR